MLPRLLAIGCLSSKTFLVILGVFVVWSAEIALEEYWSPWISEFSNSRWENFISPSFFNDAVVDDAVIVVLVVVFVVIRSVVVVDDVVVGLVLVVVVASTVVVVVKVVVGSVVAVVVVGASVVVVGDFIVVIIIGFVVGNVVVVGIPVVVVLSSFEQIEFLNALHLQASLSNHEKTLLKRFIVIQVWINFFESNNLRRVAFRPLHIELHIKLINETCNYCNRICTLYHDNLQCNEVSVLFQFQPVYIETLVLVLSYHIDRGRHVVLRLLFWHLLYYGLLKIIYCSIVLYNLHE